MKKKGFVSIFLLLACFSIVFAQNTSSSDNPIICTMEYRPVCASVQVQCIKAPCDPVQQTFGNACMMNANKNTTYLHDGECGSTELDGSTWTLQSFDDKVASGSTLSFENGNISAHVCNSINGSYWVQGNTFVVGPMMSTKMACLGDLGTYESAFDLSGATYELSTEGGKHMMITTVAGHKFQWQKDQEIIGMPNPASVYCEQNSGTLILVDTLKGGYGLCSFPDGSKCEEWAYFRGECKPAQDKIQDVWGSYLAPIHFTAEGYANLVKSLKQKFELQAASAEGTLKSAYNQLVYFLKGL